MAEDDHQKTLDGDSLDPDRLAVARAMNREYETVSHSLVDAFKSVPESFDVEEGSDDHMLYADLSVLVPGFDADMLEWYEGEYDGDIYEEREAFAHYVSIAEMFMAETDEEVSQRTAEAFAPLDPQDPWTHTWTPRAVTAVDGDMYWYGLLDEDADGYAHSEAGWVDDRGYAYDEYHDVEWVSDPGDLYYNVRNAEERPLLVGRETWEEHSSTAVLVTPRGDRYRVSFLDGVLMDHGHYDGDYEYVSGSEYEEAIHAVVAGEHWVSTDAWRGYSEVPSSVPTLHKAKSGWHSSMERSEQSDLINGFTSGDIAPPCTLMVVFGRTSNVCSTALDLYVEDGCDAALSAFFDGTGAEPGHAGVR